MPKVFLMKGKNERQQKLLQIEQGFTHDLRLFVRVCRGNCYI